MSLEILNQLLNLGGETGGQNSVMAPPQVPGAETGGFGSNLAGIGSIGQGIAGLLSAWTGLQGLKLGEEQLDFTKDVTNRNLANQATTTNAELRDRQQRRTSASGGNYQSIDAYMKQNRVQGGAL